MSRLRFGFGFDRFSGLYLLGVTILIFGLWVPNLFLTMGTLHSLASQESVVAILAIGLLIPMSAGAFDLSIGSTINISAVIVAVFQTEQGWNPWTAIVVTVAICAVIGMINGFLVVVVGIDSFIATLGTSSVILAVQEMITGATIPLPPTSHVWTALSQNSLFGFQLVVIYMIVLAIIVWWFTECTPAGRYLYAIGDNREAARLSGIATGRWTWLALTASATIAGLGGVFFSSLSGPGLSFGPGLLLPAFAAVFLGSTQLRPGRVNVWGTLIAIYALAAGVKGLQYVTGAQWLNDMFNGLALLFAVAFAVQGQRRRGRAAQRKDSGAAAPATPGEISLSQPAEAHPVDAGAD